MDQRVTDIAADLPYCTIHNAQSAYLELYNMDTGFIAGRHGWFNNSGTGVPLTVVWNRTTFPLLKGKYTGRYKCHTDTANSLHSYQMKIGRGKVFMYLILSVGFQFTATQSDKIRNFNRLKSLAPKLKFRN